jgi:hypothetical protein
MNARAAQTFQIILTRDPKNRDALSGLMETAQAAGDKALSQQAQTNCCAPMADNYEVYLSVARTEQARGNNGRHALFQAGARRLQSSGTSNGANPFAASPFAADGTAQVAAQAPDGNPFRAQQAQPQQAAAPAMPNPFALGGGTRLQMTAPRQQNGFAPKAISMAQRHRAIIRPPTVSPRNPSRPRPRGAACRAMALPEERRTTPPLSPQPRKRRSIRFWRELNATSPGLPPTMVRAPRSTHRSVRARVKPACRN